MSKDPIKHHFVTQAYLKRFSYDEKRVFVLRNNSRIIAPMRIDKICAENDFYSMFDGNKHRNTSIEKVFARLEDEIPNKVFSLIPKDLLYPYRSGGIVLNSIQKTALVEAVLLQIVKSRLAREYSQSVVEPLFHEFLAEIKTKYKNKEDVEKQIEFFKQNKKIISDNAVVESAIIPFTKNGESDELRNNLQRRNCNIFVNYTGEDLITSDNPILVGNHEGNIGKVFVYSLKDTDSILYYPLDSNHLVVLCTPERCGGLCYDEGLLTVLTQENIDLIRKLNIAQYRQCKYYAISRKEDTLRRIQ